MTSGCSMKASSRTQPSGDDPHWSSTPRADKRIDFGHLLDEPRPRAFRYRGNGLVKILDLRWLLPLDLPALPPTDTTVPTVVSHQMLAGIRDMRPERR